LTVDEPGERLADGERLQKVLARIGIGSRRVCEDLIRAGRVRVNGELPAMGMRIDVDADKIEIDGSGVPVQPDLVHRLLHKPSGVVSTSKDPQGRKMVVDLVPATPRVFPIGRLDFETEGLIILTNDGDLTHLITHPSFGVDKEYLVHVEGTPSRGSLRTLREGVQLEDGLTAPAKVSALQDGVLRVVIHEGRNRQIRRMCDAVGHRVKRLVRVRIGPIADSRLAAGDWRDLEPSEVRALYKSAGRPGSGRAVTTRRAPT